MANNSKGLLTSGFHLLWRRRRILWWVFAVNFVCGAMGTLPAAISLNRALHHTLAGQPLAKGFNLGMFIELLRLPEVSLMRASTTSYIFAFLFFLFMLFVSGGILEAYRDDRTLSTSEFFAASGAFFWRFVRLLLLSLVPFAFLWTMYPVVTKLSDYVGDRVVADQVGFWLQHSGLIILTLLALLIRLWFDLSKVRTVARNEPRMWSNMWTACGMTWRNRATLFWMYFRISVVTWIVLLIGLLIWTKLPPTAVPATFVILELVMLVQLATRLWQLASVTIWYERYAEVVPAPPIIHPPSTAEEVAPPAPSPEGEPIPGTDLEMPPAGA